MKGAVGQYRETALSGSVDAFGAGLLVVFVVILGRLAEPEGGVTSRVAAIMAGAFFATDVAWAATQWAFAEATVHIPDPNAAKTLDLLSQGLLLTIAIPIGLQYVAVGLLIVRTRVLPAVMGWIAFAAATVGLGAVVTSIYSLLDVAGFVAFIVCLILWPLAAGVLLLVRPQRSGADLSKAEHEDAPVRASDGASLAASRR